MNVAAKAAMLGEEPKKTRKEQKVEKKISRLAGKLQRLGEKGEKYASTDTPAAEQSGKERRYHKKMGKTWDKFTEASNEQIGMGAKRNNTNFTRVEKNDTPKSSSTDVTGYEPVKSRKEMRRDRKEDNREYTRVGAQEEVEKQPKKTEFTRVGTEESASKRNADDVYGATSEGNKNPKKEIEFTRVGTEEDEPTMSRRERRQQRKKDDIEWTNVPQDKTPTTTTTPSDTETKAAVAAGKYSLTKFKPKK